MSDPIVDEFFASTKALSQAQIDWLIGKGVPPLALARDADGAGIVIGAADVRMGNGPLFDFATPGDPDAKAALIFVARDRAGDPRDLVAWAPRADQVGALYGRAPVLGEDELWGPRLSGPPMIHRGVLEWLKHGRKGAVVVMPERAARALLDSPSLLAVVDGEHAIEIAKLLSSTVDLARIVVPKRDAA